MIIAPLGTPLRACAFGLTTLDVGLILNAFRSILGGAIIAFAIAWLTGATLHDPVYGSEIASRTASTLGDLGVAVFAGAVSGYAMTRRGADELAGVAIAVALILWPREVAALLPMIF